MSASPVGRVRGKRAFDRLRASKRRARRGPLAVHYLPASPDDESRYVAYAIPRRVGTAVERNTYRRRIRVAVHESAGAIPAGTYLIGVGRDIGGISFQELRNRVVEAMKDAASQ